MRLRHCRTRPPALPRLFHNEPLLLRRPELTDPSSSNNRLSRFHRVPRTHGIKPCLQRACRKKNALSRRPTVDAYAKSPVRVSLEATGIYSLDLAFALDAAEGIEVAVLNPKVANRFAQTIRRSKTDAADAEVLVEYTHRMPFTPWIAPSASSMRFRTIVRHVETLSVQSAQNQNRLHPAHATSSTPGCVIQDVKRSVASLELRIRRLRREAMTLVREADLLRKRDELL